MEKPTTFSQIADNAITDIKDTFKSAASDFKGRGKEIVQDYKGQGSDLLEEALKSSKKALKTPQKWVQKNPKLSIAIALGVAYFLLRSDKE